MKTAMKEVATMKDFLFEIVFVNKETGHVEYAVTDIREITSITPTEVRYVLSNGRANRILFPYSEKLEVNRIER